MLNTEQLAYLAGIFDGEGSVTITRTYNKHKPAISRNSRSLGNPNPGVSERMIMQVAVAMTDRAIPEWLHEEFGGRFMSRRFPGTTYKERWDWLASANIAKDFLRIILPHLRLKRLQAQLAIEFQEHRIVGHSLTLAQRQADEILCQSMHELNGRGKDSMGSVNIVERNLKI